MIVAMIPASAAAAGAATGDLVITGVVDGPLSGGVPKAIELYAVNNIPDLSVYGVGSANNGGGSDGEEFALPADSATAGEFIYIASEAVGFNGFFGFLPNYTSGAASINGDDAIELFRNGGVVDVFGDIDVDGSGQPWEYQDGWAYRVNDTGADGSTFELGNWTYSGPNALDGETTNATAATPFPIGTYTATSAPPSVVINEVDADQVSTDAAEFVELFDGGSGNTDLSGLALVLFNGSDDASYLAFDLDGLSTGGDGYFVLCGDAGNVANCDLDVSPDTNLIQNGADAVALMAADASDFPNDTPVTTDGLIDAIVYDTNDADDAGLLVLLNAGQPQVNEGGGTSSTVDSNQRCANGTGGERNTDTYDQFAPTPGTVNECGGVAPSGVVINEVDADQVSTDAAEFVELFDGGSGNTDLSGLALVLFNGSDDASYLAFDLDGLSTGGDGYFVLCGDAGNVANCDLDVSPDTNLIQNGADAVALMAADASDFPNDTPVTTDGLIDAIVYDTNDADDAGLLVLLNAGQPQVNEGGGTSSTVDSNQRCANGTGGERNTATYDQWLPTPGAENVCEAPALDLFIHEVQGPGSTTPVPGATVTVEGVVVGDFQETDLNGFFVQEEDFDVDADPATSEGIYVFEGASTVGVDMGDTVMVTGTAIEFFDVTEITNVTAVTVTGDGQVATPVALSFPVSVTNDFEHFEGMGLTVAQSMTIGEYFNFDRFGEMVLGTDRLQQPTAVFEPGSAAAAALADLNARSVITLDDGRTASNPDPARHPNGDVFDLDNLFRGGDLVANVTGVMHDSFGYRIHPTAGADYTAVNPRPLAPDDVGGDLEVAAFNVLNYFTTLDNAGPICGPNEDQGCRGADDANEFERQRTKIIAALADIDADIVGLIEIENNVDDAAVIDLVAGLNEAVGAGTYDSVPVGVTGPDVIKVAFIYKPAKVSLNGVAAVLDSAAFLDPNNTGSPKNRAALAQTFTENATGESFTAVVNHFKSKGSRCGAGDDDPEAGSCNVTRTLAAQMLTDWLAGDPTESGDPDALVLGDLNSYDKEDPIDAMKVGADDTAGTDDDYRDLVFEFMGEDAYSYVFSGQWGYLDYAMANESLRGSVTGTTVWHINADEPDILDYDTTFKKPAQQALYEPNAFRSSDHDPVIVGLNLADPMGDKAAVAADLAALLPTGDANTDKQLTKAIDSIETSLDPAWWTSVQTITTKKVFDEERKAVVQLELIVAGGGPEPDAAQRAIDVLVNADRQLAQIELIAAVGAGGEASKITQAQKAMAQGAALAEAGRYNEAINAYKAAWDAASKA
jgi:predicted extracellular nuclease